MIKLFGKPIRVNKSNVNQKNLDVGANLFIGNLDPEVDEKLLYDTFSAFGVILKTPNLARDMDSSKSKGYAFVEFSSFEAADAAIESMNGQFLMNRPVSVCYSFKKDSKNKERHGTAAERLLASKNPMAAAQAPNTRFSDSTGKAELTVPTAVQHALPPSLGGPRGNTPMPQEPDPSSQAQKPVGHIGQVPMGVPMRAPRPGFGSGLPINPNMKMNVQHGIRPPPPSGFPRGFGGMARARGPRPKEKYMASLLGDDRKQNKPSPFTGRMIGVSTAALKMGDPTAYGGLKLPENGVPTTNPMLTHNVQWSGTIRPNGVEILPNNSIGDMVISHGFEQQMKVNNVFSNPKQPHL